MNNCFVNFMLRFFHNFEDGPVGTIFNLLGNGGI